MAVSSGYPRYLISSVALKILIIYIHILIYSLTEPAVLRLCATRQGNQLTRPRHKSKKKEPKEEHDP